MDDLFLTPKSPAQFARNMGLEPAVEGWYDPFTEERYSEPEIEKAWRDFLDMEGGEGLGH